MMINRLSALLCLNAGSSSVKFSLYKIENNEPVRWFSGQMEGLLTQPHLSVVNAQGGVLYEQQWTRAKRRSEAVEIILEFIQKEAADYRIEAVGHRVVLGGVEYSKSVVIDDAVIDVLDHYAPIVPSHQPAEIEAIRILRSNYPNLKQVACFDSAFHRTKSEIADLYALPLSYRDKGIRRWGFHGLSYDFISSQLPRLDPRLAAGKTVVMHLGSGASLCGLVAGKSAYTSMGFSPLDGLMMGTRCGSLDPMIPIYLAEQYKMSSGSIEKLLIKESGLLGVSGISNDMRDLETSSDSRAKLALDLFIYMLAQQTGLAMASVQGLDGIVFTAGIGEHSPFIRAQTGKALAWAGVDIDHQLNESAAKEPRLISSERSRINVWVIPTDEESVIARDTWRLCVN